MAMMMCDGIQVFERIPMEDREYCDEDISLKYWEMISKVKAPNMNGKQ